jgi:hypothetical protein
MCVTKHLVSTGAAAHPRGAAPPRIWEDLRGWAVRGGGVGRSNASIVHGRCGTNDNPACAHSAPYPLACSVTCIPPWEIRCDACRRVGGGHPGGGGFRRSRYVRGRIVLWQRCSRLNLGPLPTSSTVRVFRGSCPSLPLARSSTHPIGILCTRVTRTACRTLPGLTPPLSSIRMDQRGA